MKVAPEDLPLIVNQMATVARFEQEYVKAHENLLTARGHLQAFMEKHYGVDVGMGQWHLDPATGELIQDDPRRPEQL
jgi:hypothetical protein